MVSKNESGLVRELQIQFHFQVFFSFFCVQKGRKVKKNDVFNPNPDLYRRNPVVEKILIFYPSIFYLISYVVFL